MNIRPVLWDGGALRILDQTLLPSRERYVRCATPARIAEAIRSLRVRGAPLIGVAAAYGMALARDLDASARLLIAARPTAVNLAWAVERVRRARDVLAEARRIHREEIARCEAIGRHGARLGAKRILTICNTGTLATGGIGTAFAVCLRSRAKVWACETRPLCQGARLTMWEAEKNGLDATLVVDGAAAAAMRAKRIDLVVVGADRIAANGDTANKIGTLGLAVLARDFRIPFYVAAPSSTFDSSKRTGTEIPIEERSPAEVSTRFPAWNPAFDVTPAKYITGFITERGIFQPRDLRRLRT
ncbi:MAG: S-methyl-5-thioribose-1-phosphate isomerase [Planctomycetes bacterium]|nr:S-methyl-5-thioribose-1-phosphate isomerase [Planctomycetota bacterium]